MTMDARLRPFAGYSATHFRWVVDADAKVATITLDRPGGNPLTFDSYAELRDLFRALVREHVKCRRERRGGFSSGGDVIIGPLTKMAAPVARVHAHDRRPGAGDAALPQPIVAAVDGTCAGAGAMIALAADIRFGTPAQNRVPVRARRLAGCDMVLHAAAPDDRTSASNFSTPPGHDRRRGPGVGILQPPCTGRCRSE
jgi:hypothetical protein